LYRNALVQDAYYYSDHIDDIDELREMYRKARLDPADTVSGNHLTKASSSEPLHAPHMGGCAIDISEEGWKKSG